ncbi:MAG: beta-ketoacyl-ACP synthase II [Alphaproteobacteria bacterium]|nr:beta-ketoacyl-ACP synthase II [Alphaproteobacteria bacterium]
MTQRTRVVVTGLGALSPCGPDASSTWEGMVHGRSGIGPITLFDTTDFPVRIAGEVTGFDAEAALGRRVARRAERVNHFAMVAADEAMAHAGFADGVPDPDRAGAYIGTGVGGIGELLSGHGDFLERGWRALSAFYLPKSITNLSAGQVAIRHNLRGPSLAVSTACATGNHSIGEAWRVIRSGEADVVVAGGTEAAVMPTAVAGFAVMKALSTRNEDPLRASRPFDAERDGFVIGEGAGLLVLESLEHAKARGAEILAEVLGYGLTCDAHHLTAPSPGGEGASRCMAMAMRAAGVNPDEVDYINAHGTSTPFNDRTESQAIRATFGAHADRLMVSSTKSVTGHLLGAAGGIEAVAVVRALQEGVVPPTATLETPDPECDLDYVPKEAREAPIRIALSNAFGFGGTNATLVFSRFTG